MDPKLAALFRMLGDKEKVAALLPLVTRYGARGAVALARAYLGPVAVRVEQKHQGEQPTVVAPDGTATKTRGGSLSAAELAILGTAVSKLLFEAGELALHNPEVSATGAQPAFDLDENGSPPAFSLAHVVAARRLWRTHAAEKQARAEAERAARLPQTPRARLQAARTERYAATTRYAYAAPTTYRGPR